jgi:gliding motility-associated-like protein
MIINYLGALKYMRVVSGYKWMRYTFLLVMMVIAHFTIKAQPTDGLIAYYSFDNCDATEDTGSGADGIIIGNQACGCGVLSNGLLFNGNTTVQILGNQDVIFKDDFTISFFFLPDPQSNTTMDILSKSEICGIDSTAELRYNPGNREVSLSLSQHVDVSVRTAYRVPADKCYHHIVFVRRDRELILFYDGIQVALSPSITLVSIENDGILTIGGGPCLANGEVRFMGVLDELRMYNRALTSFEVQQLNSPIDEITSPDTVLFTGTSMQVRLPVTCAPSIQWTPSTNVSNPVTAEPVLSPTVSTTYQVELDYGFCRATDDIHITVADSADLDCDKVFFPTGFTPNGDNLNDDWGMSNIVFLGEFTSLKVFDRWGGEVFYSEDPAVRWDGTVSGKELMPGLYVYQFNYQCQGEDHRKSGAVTIIR